MNLSSLKKCLILFSLMMCMFLSLMAQPPCTNTAQFPANITSAPSSGGGVSVEISNCLFTGEYSIISNIQSGKLYQFTITDDHYITVRDGVDSTIIIGQGVAPLTITALSDNDLQVHYNLNDTNCGQILSNPCRITTVLCPTCPPDVCDGAIEQTFIKDFGDNCSQPTGLTLASSGSTDSEQNGNCDPTNYGIDQWFTWTATTTHLAWNPSNGNPGITIWSDCATSIVCKPTPSTNTIPLSGWDLGDDLIIQIYTPVSTPADVSFCLEDPCGMGITAMDISVCNNEGTINLGESLSGDIADGDWSENQVTGPGFNASAGTFDPMGLATGDYAFTYATVCGATATVTVSVTAPADAGEPASSTSSLIRTLSTQTSTISLRDSISMEDDGGTWTDVSDTPAQTWTSGTPGPGINISGAEAVWNPQGHPVGTFRFEYRVSSATPCTGDDVISLTISVPPANDECSGALPIAIGADCVFTLGSNIGATDSRIYGGAPQACAGYESDDSEGDVWFTFDIAPDQVVKIEGAQATPGGFSADGDMALYRGSCGMLESIDCVDGGRLNFEPLIYYANESSQTETLYIRYWSYNDEVGNFNLCVEELSPPDNFNCVNATDLIIGSGTSCSAGDQVSGTTVDAISLGNSCDENIPTVWYAFTTGAQTDTLMIEISNIVSLDGSLGSDLSPTAIISIYSGNDCSSLSGQKCMRSDLVQFMPEANTSYQISVGFIDVSDDCSPVIGNQELPSGYDFDICLYTCTAPTHASADSPLDISADPACIEDDNYCAPAGSMYYSFTPAVTGSYEISTDIVTPSINAIISITNLDGQSIEFLNRGCIMLEAGISYQIEFRFGGRFGPGIGTDFSSASKKNQMGIEDQHSAYALCIELSAGPANDACASAISIPLSQNFGLGGCCSNEIYNIGCASFSPLTLRQQTAEKKSTTQGGCITFQSASNWYQTTVSASGSFGISINSSTTALAVEIYTADCGNLLNLGCFQTTNGNSWNYPNSDTQAPLAAGSTVYVQVATQSPDDFGHFLLCISDSGPFCPESLSLDGQFTGMTTISTNNNLNGPTSGLIESEQTISSGAVAEYSAGKEILLQAGFEVVTGAVFDAYIEGCEGFILIDLE